MYVARWHFNVSARFTFFLPTPLFHLFRFHLVFFFLSLSLSLMLPHSLSLSHTHSLSLSLSLFPTHSLFIQLLLLDSLHSRFSPCELILYSLVYSSKSLSFSLFSHPAFFFFFFFFFALLTPLARLVRTRVRLFRRREDVQATPFGFRFVSFVTSFAKRIRAFCSPFLSRILSSRAEATLENTVLHPLKNGGNRVEEKHHGDRRVLRFFFFF